ncbi:LPS-assembly protein LptD [Fretibacter rubidus]|uniref:LPS-assembly protein LptD n=1 Tax=Fretibacter rubidus TaxID=570162 RepID=UPI00352BB97B
MADKSKSALRALFLSGLTIPALVMSFPALAQITPNGTAAGTNRPLQLAEDSPFRDPDIIYLEADALVNDEENGVLTAKGNVEGRYQDRTLRADEVTYSTNTGQVIATGNVVLVDPTGASQYADKIELSSELEAGTATNFTARFEEGGILGASIVVRNADDGVELYNGYYTACEPCRNSDGTTDDPTWQIKARKVKQNRERNSIEYRDAVFQLAGIPVFYTPYLAHPDPSANRASGLLAPFAGFSNTRGLSARAPYFIAVDDYTDLTLTPNVYSKVNPMMEYDIKRKFYSGEVNINGSFTYGSAFDNNGNSFKDASAFVNDPSEALTGKRLRSHLFADGLFDLTDFWTTGFGIQAATDDLYLNRYDLTEEPPRFGLYQADSRRLVSQAFVVGQSENTRLSISSFGFQSLRTSVIRAGADDVFNIFREDDSELPIALPKVEINSFVDDPVFGGRFEAFGDLTVLGRKVGEDYLRGTAGVNYAKTLIVPGGIEVKPFGQARFDKIDLELGDGSERNFDRTLGQAGVDIRWPFVKSTDGVDYIIEPRVQVTQSFGDGENENFSAISQTATTSLFQDSVGLDFGAADFYASNKALGYDFWQEGLRTDVGASLSANWNDSRASLFLGQSFASGYDDSFTFDSGLEGDNSDIIGEFEIALGSRFTADTRVRYDDADNVFRRIDTGFRYNTSRFSADARYYRLNKRQTADSDILLAPAEELSGGVTVKLTDNWSTRYQAFRDIDADVTRRQDLSLIYDDQCTRIEFIYNRSRNDIGIVGDNEGFGVRISLLTLGEFD